MGGEHVRQDTIVPVAVVAGAAPACIAFCLLIGFAIAEASGVPLFAVAPPANVAEAAAYGDAARMLALQSSGQDVNRRWPTRPGLFDASSALEVTALQAAILTRRPEVAMLLLRRGARADNPAGLACLAQALEQGTDLPPAVFGAEARAYYTGPLTGGREALVTCGFPG